jgi:hypothetical protein
MRGVPVTGSSFHVCRNPEARTSGGWTGSGPEAERKCGAVLRTANTWYRVFPFTVYTVMVRCKNREYICKFRKVGNNRSRPFVCFKTAAMNNIQNVHCKKELAVFPSLAGMSLIKLFLGGNNLVFSRPERVWSVTSRLGTGKWLTLFYSVGYIRGQWFGQLVRIHRPEDAL